MGRSLGGWQAVAGFALHVNLVAAFHDHKQGEQGKGDETNENLPHVLSP